MSISLVNGLYETLITERLGLELRELAELKSIEKGALSTADAGLRFSALLSDVFCRAIQQIPEKERVEKGAQLLTALLTKIAEGYPATKAEEEFLQEPIEQLWAITGKQLDGSAKTLKKPILPLLDTALLTNSRGEPRVGHQINSEIDSADSIDLIMAFIRRSGLNPLRESLRRHLEQRRPLRVLTTIFTGSTEREALEELQEMGAEVRISYDTSSTRLHAKSWIFRRDSGFTTAYVGSSNLTRSAQVDGIEWNLRLSKKQNPDVIEKMKAVFESCWLSNEFLPFDSEQFRIESNIGERKKNEFPLVQFDIKLYPYQERLLEEISLAKEGGKTRNLLVSATGTGKTVMAAVYYSRFRVSQKNDHLQSQGDSSSSNRRRARLLFVAHREEILDQSLNTFRHVLKDGSFGEKWVGGERPLQFEHIFASIQSLARADLNNFDPKHFDIIIIDEFHHAAAKSYRSVIDWLRPKELLGLTATPERGDGQSILDIFEGKASAELRLWDAIDLQRLCPFQYYGIHDNSDLSSVNWKRGTGYDVDGLTKVYTANDRWSYLVIEQLLKRVPDWREMRALGFCVGVEHARFMARKFNESGIKAEAIWGESSDAERRGSIARLRDGDTQIIFTVDLFNEGIDLPFVDTLLLLRPTESSTIFLQQLGRGLRKMEGKDYCTVLDYIGQHRQEYRFDRRFISLLGGTRKELERQIEQGFPYLPTGCHLELDSVSQRLVLQSLKNALPSKRAEKIRELKALANTKGKISLKDYLYETGLALDDIYKNSDSWSNLLDDAGLDTAPSGPEEAALRRGCRRILHVDDRFRIQFYRSFLKEQNVHRFEAETVEHQRMIRMLVATICSVALKAKNSLEEGIAMLFQHPQVCEELLQILDLLEEGLTHTTQPLENPKLVPLRIHARYTRVEILAAFGVGEGATVMPWQTGVYWERQHGCDLLAFTLDKSSSGFSPSTRYKDYAISRELIHWESQSVTRAASDTGQRYQKHEKQGSQIMLFARERADDRAFYFLGPASYVRHQSEQPMAITWRLQVPLPGDIFAAFATIAVA